MSFYGDASTILARVALDLASLSSQPPQIQQLHAGSGVTISADATTFTDACCKGLLFVAFDQIELREGTEQKGGPLYTSVAGTVGVLRCAPTIDDAGRSPTPAQHSATAMLVYEDAEIMLGALRRLAVDAGLSEGDLRDVLWSPIEPEGGCGGGVVTFTIASDQPCPEPPS